MNSCSPKLPVICLSDLQTLKPGSSKRVKVRSDVRKALEEYGCFEAQCDQVSMEHQESLLEAMEELFALPTETKQRNVGTKPFVGYLTHNDLSESFGIKDANILESAYEFTLQLWPKGNMSISKKVQSFAEKLAELDVMVRRLVMESYGIEKYIDEHLDSTNYRLRLMKYIAPPEDGGNATVGANKDDGAKDNADGDANAKADGTSIGVNVDVVHDVHDNASDHNVDVGVSVDLIVAATDGIKINGDANVDASDGVNANVDAGVVVDGDVDANTGIGISDGVDTNVDAEEAKLGLPCHTDKSLLTILYQHQIEGLEVKTKDDKWIRVKPAPDTLIVMAGDSLCVNGDGKYERISGTSLWWRHSFRSSKAFKKTFDELL